jgi:chromosome segregation ATPase
MWPKILFELLPHLTRLVPMADKYLTTRSASERAQEAALAALGTEVRGELSQMGEAHSGLQRQLQEQSAQLAETAVEVTRTRMGVEGLESRVGKMEEAIAGVKRLAVVGLVGVVGAVGLLVVVLVRLRAH